MSEKNEIEIKLKDFILSKYKSIRIFSKWILIFLIQQS